MEKYTIDNERFKKAELKSRLNEHYGINFIEEAIEQEEKRRLEFDTLIEETIKREEKKRIDKINKFVYNFIKSHYSPFDIKYAFSSYDSFCEFIERVENDIRKDEGIYKL